MATQTYTQLQDQIAALSARAEVVRKAEIVDVVAKIKEAIRSYGITSKDLFGTSSGPKSGSGNAKSGRSTKAKKTATSTVKFADGKGGVWTGRGPRPSWLRAALTAGKSIDDFRVESAGHKESATTKTASPVVQKKPTPTKKANKSKPERTIKYTDGAGKNWSGRGPKPAWVKDAIAAGKSLDDLKI